MANIAIGAIQVYRRHLSPRKGYSCAHNALRHCGSCSDFGLKVYRRLGFSTATALMLRRLADCRADYARIVLMKARAEDDQPDPPHDRRKRDASICTPVDALNCLPFPDAACLDVGGCEIFSCVPW
jgi:uncharacterized protein